MDFYEILSSVAEFSPATMVERDDNHLPFPETHAEVLKAKSLV